MHKQSPPKAIAGLLLSAVVAMTPSGCAQGLGTPADNTPSATSPITAVNRIPTAADYGWTKRDHRLTTGFCITWVAGLTPNQIAQRLGGELVQHDDRPPTPEATTVTAAKGHAVIGVLQFQGWSMIVERDGRLGVTQEHLRELSKESRALSTRRDGEYKGRFLLAQDGTVTVDFDPWEPTIRRGDDPDALVQAMANAGFTMPSDPDEDYQDSRGTEAAFALIESVTGITMTRDQLQSTSYVIVTFPDHHYQGPGPINPGVKPRTNLPG